MVGEQRRPPPAVITRDYGPYPVLSNDPRNKMDQERWRVLMLALRRYYRWVDSGRAADPWASGVGQGQRYDTPRVVKGPPVGGYGPGTASPPEEPAELLEVDRVLERLPVHQQRLCRWKAVGDGGRPLTNDVIAGRLGLGPDAVKAEWARTATRVYWMLAGQA